MIRGALSSLIYSRIFQLNSVTSTTQGSATLTLTSTDVERICSSFEGLHELWANPIEVAVAVWLLQQHLGVACIAPAFVVICASSIKLRGSKLTTFRLYWSRCSSFKVYGTGTKDLE